MRHRKRRNKLKASPSHVRAMRRNLVASLFEHGQVTTTVAKAKAFRPFAEKLITLARKGVAGMESGSVEGKAAHLHCIRRAASLLGSKEGVRTLFAKVAPATGERPGGYTRILRLGTPRLGDNAPQAILMLVDNRTEPEAETTDAAEAAAEPKKGKKKKAKEEAAAAAS